MRCYAAQVEYLERVVEDMKGAMEKQAELVELSQITAAAQMRSVESKYGAPYNSAR